MSTSKRSSSSEDRQFSVKKIKKSDTRLDDDLSEFGQLTQSDVVYYQKESIFRLMNLFRQKNKRLNNDLTHLQTSYNNVFNYFNLLNNWWFEILLIFNKISVENEESLLINLDKESDKDKIIDQLKNKKSALIELIKSKDCQPNSADNDKLLSLEESLTILNVFKNQLQDENTLLKDKIEELNQELDHFITQKDRSESKTLNRINENTKSKESNNVKTEESEVKDEKLETADDQSSSNADTKLLIDKLKVEVLDLKSKNNVILEQLSNKDSKILELEKTLIQLTNKFSNLTEDDLIKSPIYKSLTLKNTQLMNDLDNLKNQALKNGSKITQLESSFSENELKLNNKLQGELSSNNSYSSKLENDLIRIRTDRDELSSKLSILKSEKGKSELTEEYKKLNDILQSKLDSKIDIIEELSSNNDDGQDIESIKKTNKILLVELKQLEDAFKQTRLLASNKLSKYVEADSYINKLKIEKTKADQKYFQSMRLKDSLTSQNKVLINNNLKQIELIENLKLNENELKKKLSIFEKDLIQKLVNIESLKLNEIKSLESKIRDLELKLKSLATNNSDLNSSLISKQESISSLQSDNDSLKSSITQLNKKIDYLSSSSSFSNSNKASTPSQDDEISRALLVMTKCQLCNKNFKNVTLKVCGHCFCLNCINDRLNSRMRKCPNCNKQFSSYDLLNIHL